MSKTYKGIDLKNALKHYGRPGMKKGRHLPGTTWWQESIDGWRRAKYEAGLRAKLPKAWTSERNAPTSKASSQAAGSSSASSGTAWERMKGQLEYELRKQRVKPAKGTVPNIRPQKRAMDAADEAKRRALEEEDIRRAAEIHGITPEEERRQRVRGTLHQYVRDAQDRADEDKKQEEQEWLDRNKEKGEKLKKRVREDAAHRKQVKEKEDAEQRRMEQLRRERDEEEAERAREEREIKDAMDREIKEEERKIREKYRKEEELKKRFRRQKPKWFG